MVKINPIEINLYFIEDSLNSIFNSPINLQINTSNGLLQYASLDTNNFLINLNNNEILVMESFKLILDKNINIQIPSICVMISMTLIYKIIKMLSIILQNSFISFLVQKNISMNNVPIDMITCKVLKIQLMMKQTKSKRNISLNFENTELTLKNIRRKAELFGKTKGKFTASDGFLSFDITQHFMITVIGEFSENVKNCSIQVREPIIFELTTFTINQILKNLTATEDEAKKQYSIINETGAEISIIINNTEYKLKSQEFLQNITNLSELDIKVKIGEIINPFQLYSTYSKVSTPLYFGKNFILVWMDTKKLQLRLLSPILFKNKSSIDLEVQTNNKSFILYDNSIYCLEYTSQKIDSIVVKYDGQNQSINLSDSSAIRFKNKYIIVSKKRKTYTLRTTISFYTYYYFRNEMISNIVILIKGENTNEKVNIKPYKITPIPFFPSTFEIISFNVMETKYFEGIHVDLNLNEMKNKRCLVSTKDKKGKEFILQFSLNVTQMNIISISPFLIYFNSLTIPLVFGLSDDEKLTPETNIDLHKNSLSDIFPVKNSNNIWKVDDPIMFSPLIKTENSKKTKIYITSAYSNDWSPNSILISNFDSSSDLNIPINDEIVSLATCYVLYSSSLQPNTFFIFVSPKYAIINQTSEMFSIDLFDGEPIEIHPNSTISVTIIRKSLEFSVAIIPKKKKQNISYSRRINIEKISSQYISVINTDWPILLQMSVEKNIHFITIMLNRSLPYLFINKTEFRVIFSQKNTNDIIHVIMPNESLPFYLFDENMPSIIVCEINNEIKFEVDINKPSFPIEIGYMKQNNDKILYYYVDLSSIKGSVITLINCIKDQIMNSNENKTLHLDFDSIKNESLINILTYDFPRLKNDPITFNLNFNQISIIVITEKYEELCIITLKDIIINSIINEFETNTQVEIGLIKLDDQNKYAVYPSVFQILPLENCPAVLFKVNSFGCHKYGKIEFKLRPIYFQIDLSFISDLIGNIFYFESAKTSTSNTDDFDSNESNSENSDENFAINHFKFKMKELPFTEILHNIMPNQTKYHINKIIIHPFIIHATFHTTTTRANHRLKMAINTVKIMFKPDAATNLTEWILNKTNLSLSFCESSLCYISSMLNAYTNSPPNIRTDVTSFDVLKWGISSLFSSFKEGFRDVFDESYQRGNVNGKNDYCGYIVGTAIGFTKCAANMASGICILSASLFSSTRRLFFNEKDEFIDKREYQPLLGMHGSKNDHLIWYTGSISSCLIEIYTYSIYISKGDIFIKNFLKAEINKNEVVIHDIYQNTFKTKFDNENQAIAFYNIIESQLLRRKLLKIHDEKNINENI